MVYRDMMEVHIEDLTDENPWAQPFLIPKGWALQRIEFGDKVVSQNSDGDWTIDGTSASEQAAKIAKNWSELVAQEIQPFDTANEGQTVLVFVADTTQPIVYRVLIIEDEIVLYRLNDRRRFAYPAEIRDVMILM